MGVRVGVVGLGSMGQRHLDTLLRLPAVSSVVAASRSPEKRAAAEQVGRVSAVADYTELPGRVDAAVVAVRTSLHAEVAGYLLAQGVHVLAEKPIAATVAEAEQLVSIAQSSGRVFMVGQIERFNPAYMALRRLLDERGGLLACGGAAVQAWRMGTYDGRAADVGVELDLMIHDVDALGGLARGCRLALRSALGLSVVTAQPDNVMAEIDIVPEGAGSGGRAVVLASRIADAKRRMWRINCPGFQAELDFMQQRLAVSIDGSSWQEQEVVRVPPLDAELTHFLQCVTAGTQPDVTGSDGLRALQLCAEIGAAVAESSALA